MSCAGAGRPVSAETWRTYYYCPTCRKRLSAEDAGRFATHPDPRYHHIIVPAHEART